MITPEQFCLDFFKDIQAAAPLERKAIVNGYAKTLQAMLDKARREGVKK